MQKLTYMILDDILQNVILQKTIGETEINIENIQFDSRKVGAGTVFVTGIARFEQPKPGGYYPVRSLVIR